MDNSNIDLKTFNDRCDDFLTGKFILAEYKISAILKSINDSVKIKDIVATCVENYDFIVEFKKSVGDNQIITVPEDAKSIIAFCFGILYNIDNKNYDFFDFLSTYYDYNDLNGMESYKSFARSIILPFKEAINTVYMKTHILVETDDYKNNIYNRIKKIANYGLEKIEQYKLRDINQEELEVLLNCMISACVRNDKEAVYAVLIAIDYFSLTYKRVKDLYEEFKECFDVN